MKNDDNKLTQPNGISIDSENDVTVGNDVVGRDKVVNVYPEKKQKNKETNLVDCPLCGTYNDQRNSFRCLCCHREYICLQHRNPRALICSECFDESQNLIDVFYVNLTSVLLDTSPYSSALYSFRASDLFTTQNTCNLDSWLFPFQHGKKYNRGLSGIESRFIQETKTHSSGKINITVQEYWNLWQDEPFQERKGSRTSYFQLVRTENKYMQIESCTAGFLK